jgi:hypothetical protein
MPISWPAVAGARNRPEPWIEPEVPQGWEAAITFQSADRALIRLQGQPGEHRGDKRYPSRSVLVVIVDRVANSITLESIARREDQAVEEVSNLLLDFADALHVPEENRFFHPTMTTAGSQAMIVRFVEAGVLQLTGPFLYRILRRAVAAVR